ncbi:MAG: hypothetical protein GXO99_00260 [Nitrospirae bacterium]|nr:hypothetical protein [Nitrospirota bacterium]
MTAAKVATVGYQKFQISERRPGACLDMMPEDSIRFGNQYPFIQTVFKEIPFVSVTALGFVAVF